MKIQILAGVLFLSGVVLSTHASVMSQWTFESPNTPADVSNAAAFPNAVAPGTGTGNASGVHASTSTDWTTPAGSASTDCWSANTWATDDYWQFAFSTTGFENIQFAWDQRSSSTGPRDFGFFYSLDGTSFTQVGADYAVGTVFGALSADLGAIAAVENQPTLFIRLLVTSGTAVGGAAIGTAGTSAIDNFTVSGTEIPRGVPDTGATALLFSLPLAGLWLVRAHSVRHPA